jgi:DNA-binding transcriptional LysR family regulator
MAVNVSTELLRSFVAIVDYGSMMRASERVFLTQSAISLQMKRLEECLQKDLFRRSGRTLALTQAGEQLLVVARQILELNDRLVEDLAKDGLAEPIQIGVVQDFAEAILPDVLGRFVQNSRTPQLQVRVQGSVDLLRALKAGELDLAMAVGHEGDAAAVRTVPMLWMGKQHLTEESVLPLVLVHQPCLFRDAALSALEAAGRPYRVVLETPHLSGLRAAVQGGLGVTCRTRLFVDDDTIEEIPAGQLPDLPRACYTLHAAREAGPLVTQLVDQLQLAARRVA